MANGNNHGGLPAEYCVVLGFLLRNQALEPQLLAALGWRRQSGCYHVQHLGVPLAGYHSCQLPWPYIVITTDYHRHG
jgi:hypothetical protein